MYFFSKYSASFNFFSTKTELNLLRPLSWFIGPAEFLSSENHATVHLHDNQGLIFMQTRPAPASVDPLNLTNKSKIYEDKPSECLKD